MAQGNPYARLVTMMQRQGKKYNGYDMQLAELRGTEPVSIALNGQTISGHICGGRMADPEKDEAVAEMLEAEEAITPALKDFLKELYEENRMKAGDMVLVQRVGNSFFICGKVVQT